VWNGRTASLAALGSAAQARHLGRRARLVDEDQAVRIEVGLCLEPCLAARGYVGPLLLLGVRRFF
jgi:hypothetical protein